MRKAGIMALTLALMAVAVGCGQGGDSGPTPRDQGIESTYHGSYQVKGLDDDRVTGVGVYSDGSFRIIMEGLPNVVIHNQKSGENWMINVAQREYQAITHEEALLKSGFMPHLSMEGYFELERFWVGPEFRMDTADGRSIRAYLDGPGYLPTLWKVESQGRALKNISWEYRRVNHVSQDNFEIPDGLTRKA